MKNNIFYGLILGTAIGDAIGLPFEGMKPQRPRKLFGAQIKPDLIALPFLPRYTMCSDDTEHLVITAIALLKAQGDPAIFQKALAQLMKKWFLTLPSGIGKSTIKACIKLLLGFSASKSGIYSAGNGAAMRAAVIGAFYAHDEERMTSFINHSILITHTDPKALQGALVIAHAASLVSQEPNSDKVSTLFFEKVLPLITDTELVTRLIKARACLESNDSLAQYLIELKLDKSGITGYTNNTIPAVIYAWLRYFGDYQQTIEQLILAGGDTDTCAAIAGALAGISNSHNLPKQWQVSIANYPLSIHYLEKLSNALQNNKQGIKYPSYFISLFHNLIFFIIVMLHGFRRLAPF